MIASMMNEAGQAIRVARAAINEAGGRRVPTSTLAKWQYTRLQTEIFTPTTITRSTRKG